MWLKLLHNLGSVLKKKVELNQVLIQIGGNNVSTYPCIQLIRGNMTKMINCNHFMGGTYNFFVDIWVKNEDPNPENGYCELSALEEIVEPTIYEWLSTINQELNLVANAEISEITSDMDKLRPVCMSRYTIKVQFKKGN